tara:strand:+ start:5801 stop:6058 length:258 start_codon:yes stop_codon:yes gene_type:complete
MLGKIIKKKLEKPRLKEGKSEQESFNAALKIFKKKYEVPSNFPSNFPSSRPKVVGSNREMKKLGEKKEGGTIWTKPKHKIKRNYN